jgi:hypothetical protein
MRVAWMLFFLLVCGLPFSTGSAFADQDSTTSAQVLKAIGDLSKSIADTIELFDSIKFGDEGKGDSQRGSAAPIP